MTTATKFKKAEPKQAYLKVGFYGLPGSGKTLTALLIAEGLAKKSGKRVAYIDTERGTDFYAQAVEKRAIHPESFDFDALYSRSLLDALEARRLGHSLTVTTDDGSAGQRGLVTDPLGGLLAGTGAERVYACGPMPMLAAVSRLAAAAGVPCQVAVEEQMACGTGICFSCVLPVGDGGGAGPGATRMARSCLEGPVFDGTAIAWAELGYPELEPSR